MHIILLYSGLLALLFVALSVRTLRMRRRLRVAVGDGGDERLLRAMRVHANFAEYAPFALFLIYLLELTGGSAILVHALGSALLAGRASHAIGVAQVNETFAFRVAGMSLTLTVITIAALRLLYVYATTAAAG